MNQETLFESMDGIDEEILERSEKPAAGVPVWKAVAALAACLCVAVAAWSVILGAFMQNDTPEGTTGAEALPPDNGNWTVNYVLQDPDQFQTQVLAEPIEFNEDLSQAELEAILPENRPQWMQGTGYAGFFEDKTPGLVMLRLESPIKHASLSVRISLKETHECVIHPGEFSICNGVEYYVYEYAGQNDRVALTAMGWIRDRWYIFSMGVWSEDLEQGKAAFKEVLESFTYYAEPEKPGWSALTYDYIPEIVDMTLDWEGARQDESFGALIPAVPEGAETVTGKRYKSAQTDYLRLSWEKDGSRGSWEVSRYDPATDSDQMASTDDIVRRLERPGGLIYEAEDLTERFVRESTFKRVGQWALSVKYGEMLIQINVSGPDNDWIWEQLLALGIVADTETQYTFKEVFPGDRYAEPEINAYYPIFIEPALDIFEGSPSCFLYESDTKRCFEVQITPPDGGMSILCLQVTAFDAPDRLVAVENEELYDLSAYDSPWDPDIPEEQRKTMKEPIFEAEELTPEVLHKRVYTVDTAHTEPRMEFGIRYGDTVVYVFASGISPETAYAYLAKVQM